MDTINRDNYEMWFVDYMDDTLHAAQRRSVEAFLAANPDLKEELALYAGAPKVTPMAAVLADKEHYKKPVAMALGWRMWP